MLLCFWFGCLHFASCLIALARTYSTMLKISSKNWQACRIFHLREKTFSFLSLTMVLLAMVFRITPLWYWGSFLLFLGFWMFCCKRGLTFVKGFFLLNLDDYMAVFFHSVNVMHHIDCFPSVESSSNSRNKSHLVTVQSFHCDVEFDVLAFGWGFFFNIHWR